MERNPWLRALIVIAVLLAALFLFERVWAAGARFADTILVLFLAAIMAFLLNPVVRRLMVWRRMPRLGAVIIVYVGLLAAIALLGLLIVPPTIQQVADLGEEIPRWAERTPEYIDDAQGWLDRRGIDFNLQEFYESEEVRARFDEAGRDLAERAVATAQAVLVVLLYLVLTLIIGFYLLLDGPRILDGLIRVTPARYREDLRFLLQTIDRTFGAYVRSWAILGVVYGLGTGLAMAITDIPFAFPAGVFAGFMLIIPFVGDIVAIVPPLLIGLLSVPLRNVLIALIILVTLQQLVLHILRPKIMGDRVGLHPVLVLVAFLVGARAAGIWGAFFAVPVAAVLQSVIALLYHRYIGADHELGPATHAASTGTATAPDAPGERQLQESSRGRSRR